MRSAHAAVDVHSPSVWATIPRCLWRVGHSAPATDGAPVSFVLDWVQNASRLLQEARNRAVEHAPLGWGEQQWLKEVDELLKPKTPRTGD